MECAVCLEDPVARCKLVCGHVFCRGCIKTWCTTGTGEGCPMCRRPVYFRGFRGWHEEAEANRLEEIIGVIFDEIIETLPLDIIMDELLNAQRTWRYLVHEGIDPDEIEYVLLETDMYFSDRCITSKNEFRELPRGPCPPYAPYKECHR